MACACWPSSTNLHKGSISGNGVIASGNEKSGIGRPTRDPLYAWVDEGDKRGEMDMIISIRKSLTPEESDQLSSEPDHIKHDLMLCRFIRGHGNRMHSALKAVRAHLKHRRKHRAFLSQILASVPADTEDFNADLSPLAERFQKIKMLQLPGRHGTNDGMPLSLIALGHFKIQDFNAFDDEELALWFLSLVEIRSLCLHNQSMRERRMARVVEVRDCNGVDWTQFLTSPGMLRKLPRLLEIALVYPELVGSALMFNMNPGSMATMAIRNMAPKNNRDKIIFADRGTWEECICVKRGLSLEAVTRWTRHVQDFRQSEHRQTLTPNQVQGVRAIHVAAGEKFSWRVHCRHGSEHIDKSSPLMFVSVHLFKQSLQTPTHEVLYAERHAMDVVCDGTLQASADGIALIEIELIARRPLDISAFLVLGSLDAVNALDNFDTEAVLSRVEEIASECESTYCHSSWMLGRFGVAMLILILGLLLHFSKQHSS